MKSFATALSPSLIIIHFFLCTCRGVCPNPPMCRRHRCQLWGIFLNFCYFIVQLQIRDKVALKLQFCGHGWGIMPVMLGRIDTPVHLCGAACMCVLCVLVKVCQFSYSSCSQIHSDHDKLQYQSSHFEKLEQFLCQEFRGCCDVSVHFTNGCKRIIASPEFGLA